MVINRFYLLLLVLLFCCQQEEKQPIENPTQIKKYFLLKDFVENQITVVEGDKVRKSTRIKGEEEVIEMIMDAEDWRKELHIFIQADINKATLSTSYDTEKTSHSTIHRLKPGQKSPIQEVKIDFQNKEVSRVSFVSHQENLFYTSSAKGELHIDTLTGKMDAYQVSGIQKVWFLSPNEMAVKGKLLP
jgi:hypothetical protein